VLTTATDAVRRSDPFTITKDTALEPASVAMATSLPAHGAERGRGCAISFAVNFSDNVEMIVGALDRVSKAKELRTGIRRTRRH
jgi:hypothetical protein